MQHGEDLEVTVRTSARELAVYCVFLSILVIGMRTIRFYIILSSWLKHDMDRDVIK